MVAAISSRAVGRRGETVDDSAKALTAYLLVISGAFFPLRFIPINYEWIALAATGVFLIYLISIHSVNILSRQPIFIIIISICASIQVAKLILSNDSIEYVQFFRGLYGLGSFYIGFICFTSTGESTDRIIKVMNRVLILLTGLVALSIVTGFRFYATGFLPDAGDMDVQDQLSSGNYRIITYYSSLVTFLLFYNQANYLKKGSNHALIAAICAFILVLLTGTRSLIAPCLFVSAVMFVLYAKPTKTLVALAVIAVAGLAVDLVIPDLVNAYVSRFMVGELFDAWREMEQALALNAIRDNLLVGIPLGVPYTHAMSAMAGGVEGYALNADYDLHNEYLWFLLYFGVIGSMMLIIFVFSSMFLVYKNGSSSQLIASFLAYLVVMFVAMNYSGILLRGYGALWYGIIFALCTRNPMIMLAGRKRKI